MFPVIYVKGVRTKPWTIIEFGPRFCPYPLTEKWLKYILAFTNGGKSPAGWQKKSMQMAELLRFMHKTLQKDYADLWELLSDLLQKLAGIVGFCDLWDKVSRTDRRQNPCFHLVICE